jgi:tripartite-type tricarboxylate transporter receptor subunit TctC
MSMKAKRSMIVSAVMLGLFFVLIPVFSFAQDFPTKPVNVIVTFAPGGTLDGATRILATKAEKLLGQPVVVSNVGGGGGSVALAQVATKKPDGYEITSCTSTGLIRIPQLRAVPYGPNDFIPVMHYAAVESGVVVKSDSPYKTFKDLVAAAQREPNSLVASVASPGGPARMLLWIMERETGARVKVVANKSGADAILQVMGGHTHFSPENLAEGYAAVESKKLRVLAVTSLTRLALVPDTPTMKELGYNIHIGTGRGFAMPAAVPKEAAAHMEGVLKGVYNSAAWKEHAERNFYENLWMGSADYAKYLAARSGEVREFQQGIGLLKP